MTNFFKWLRYLKSPWFRNSDLGLRFLITNKKGQPEYCYRCRNFSNVIVAKYRIFNVPICTKHFNEEQNKQ